MAKKDPPPSVNPYLGANAPAPKGAMSICEPGNLGTDPALGPVSVLVEPIADHAAPKKAEHIVFVPRFQARPDHVPMHPTMVPDADIGHEVRAAPRPGPYTIRVEIISFGPAFLEDAEWVTAGVYGSKIGILEAPGHGRIRIATTLAAMVDSISPPGVDGVTTVNVIVRYSPDPDAGTADEDGVRRKFRGDGGKLQRELKAAIAHPFSHLLPVCGTVVRLVGAPPFMRDEDMGLSGFTARDRSRPGRAPVRAEIDFSFVDAKQAEALVLYKKTVEQSRLCGFSYLWLKKPWWLAWNRPRLAKHQVGEELSVFGALESASTTPQNPTLDAEIAELATGVVGSLAALTWNNPELREALLAKGVAADAIPGTILGDIDAEPLDDNEK